MMDVLEALIVSRAIERTVIALCAPLLLYLGFRLFAQALEDNHQAHDQLCNEYKFQPVSLLPGSAFLLLATLIGFIVFSQALPLSKTEDDLLLKLDQIAHPVARNAPSAPNLGVGRAIEGGNSKPSLKPF
jgi:hypothetical protein